MLPESPRLRRLAQRISALEDDVMNAAAVLDRLRIGVILLDAKARVQRTNAAAKRLLEARDGLLVGPDGLRAASEADTTRLRRMVAGAVTGATESGGVLTLKRPSGRRRLQLVIASPRRDVSHVWSMTPPLMAVFVADPDEARPLPPEHLRSSYGLTPAQARVAVLLGQGLTPHQIAERTSVQVNTVRVHLKKIFALTGTRRQSELVRLLLHNAIRVGRD